MVFEKNQIVLQDSMAKAYQILGYHTSICDKLLDIIYQLNNGI